MFVSVLSDGTVNLWDPQQVLCYDTVPYISISSNPFLRLYSHNRVPGFRPGCKTTKAAAPNLKLALTIGPFFSHGVEFRDIWRGGSRKIKSRIIMGLRLANKYGKTVYSDDAKLLRKYWKERKKKKVN